MTASPTFLSENKRSAHKYDLLLRALRRTNEIIRKIETAPTLSTSGVLAELLPQFVAAIEAERGFVARRSLQKTRGAPFETITVHPTAKTLPEIASSPLLEQMAQDGNARILVGQEADGIIVELRSLGAHSAVMATFRGIDHVYLVGLCDKKDSEAYPFLAADRVVLENLLSLMAIGLRAVERRQLELHLIQEISERVAQGGGAEGQDGDVWQMIVQGAATLSATQYAGVYALDEKAHKLTPHGTWDARSARTIGHGTPLSLDDASLNAAVARTGASCYIKDVTQEASSFLRAPLEQNVHSAYCAPLVSQERLVGTLYVASTQIDGIPTEQRDAIDRLAPHAAIALQNALLLEERNRAIRLDEDTIRVQHAIADILQVNSQAEQIREVLQRFFPNNVDFFIATYDAEKQEISLPIVYERQERIVDTSRHALYCARKTGQRHGLIDFMIEHQLPVLDVPDFDAWEQCSEIEDVYRKGMKCCLLMELRHDGHLLGWTGFRGFGQPFLFDSNHRALLEKTAPHIAIVLHNARLYGQRLRELEVVSRFQTQITGLSPTEQAEIEEISHKVVDALKELGTHTGDMYMILYDHVGMMLRTPMAYEEGVLLGAAEIERRPNYRTRRLAERNGLVEWILLHDQQVLARNREEIEKWRDKGVTDLPLRACCWLGVPMKVRGEPIGVMVLRSLSNEGQFNESHLPLFQTIASQAAITIDNARMYQHVRQEAKQMDALYYAGRAIAAAGLERDAVLHSILEQATSVTRCHLGAIYLSQTDHLQLVAAWPPERFARLRSKFGRIGLNQRSIMVRALRENQAQLVPNVRADTYYLDISEGKTNSELAVVLRREATRTAETIGVINVEHQEVGGLTESDRQILILLSNLAVVAIQNAEKAQDLSRILTIAVMGAWGADVIHDVKQEISTIRWTVDSMRSRVDLSAEILQELAEIDEAAARMRVPDIPTEARKLESVGDLADTPTLDHVLADEVRSFGQQTGIHVETEWGCAGVSVRIQDEWLRRLVRHYLRNAQKHLPHHKHPIITLTTKVEDGKAVVLVQDAGHGVRPEIQSQLFSAEIPHDGRPPGRGLLLVRLIAEAHGGRAWLAWSEANKGSCFAFCVPVVQ